MMPHITGYDIMMIEKTKEWLYLGEDDEYHLKENAPDDIKKHYELMKKKYNMI